MVNEDDRHAGQGGAVRCPPLVVIVGMVLVSVGTVVLAVQLFKWVL